MEQLKYTDNPRIQILLSLGEPTAWEFDAWPDYVGNYGFTVDDVPALLELHADETLDALGLESTQAWAPVYAWRILGQFGCVTAITGLVSSFNRLCDDDLALTELPCVVGMIGPAAIPALVLHWQQTDKDEFNQIMALDALYEIVRLHPASRTRVMTTYREYMLKPNTSLRVLNGLLMGRLMDLKAIEAIDEIRQLYALGCVDISCAGDLEEVEIALGLRTTRLSPRPNYAQLHGFDHLASPDYDADLNDEDLMTEGMDFGDELDDFFALLDAHLLRYNSEESIRDASELDGFFAALACAPNTIMPSSWMPAIWGGEQYMPDWESEAEIELFTSLILQHYNTVMGDFQDSDYQPLFVEDIVDASNVLLDVLLVDAWCAGFVRGLGLWGALSTQDMARMEHYLEPIRYFCREAGAVSVSEADNIALQQRIKPAVDSIPKHFFRPAKRADSTFVHTAPKVGRNDPCLCGSGKKYKKCCGLH